MNQSQEQLATALQNLRAVFPDLDFTNDDVRRTVEKELRDSSLDTVVEEFMANGYAKKDLTGAPAPETVTVTTELQQTLSEIFPDIMRDCLKRFVEGLVKNNPTTSVQALLDIACDHLAGGKEVKRKELEDKRPAPQPLEEIKRSQEELDTSFLERLNRPVTDLYKQQCEQLLANEFSTLRIADIRKHSRSFGFHYYPTWRFLHSELNKIRNPDANSNKDLFSMSHRRRLKRISPEEYTEEIKKEVAYISYIKRQELTEKDIELAKQINDRQYTDEGLIECEICMEEYAFESMVQCFDGHLFCAGCVKSWIEETVYGNVDTKLKCLNTDCEYGFPRTQLQRALTGEELKKLEDMLQEVEVQKAGVVLKSCPFCSSKYHFDEEYEARANLGGPDSVHKCENPSCKKESCTLCFKENHLPKKCHEVVSDDVIRKKNEEALSSARIRHCSNRACRQALVKDEGCNKIPCPKCQTNTCYVCSTTLSKTMPYDHFCKCNRQMVDYEKCTKCSLCMLFFKDTVKMDEKKVDELQKQLEEANCKAYEREKSNKVASNSTQSTATTTAFRATPHRPDLKRSLPTDSTSPQRLKRRRASHLPNPPTHIAKAPGNTATTPKPNAGNNATRRPPPPQPPDERVVIGLDNNDI